MQITRQSEYAIRTLIEIAKFTSGEFLSVQYIASKQSIPIDFLKKTIKFLLSAGLVVTQRGMHGGIKLGRSADKISLLDIITAVEGPIAINICLGEGNNCPNKNECLVSPALAKAQQAFVNELAKVSLASLVKAKAN